MIYISHLLEDGDLREILRGGGFGVETIEFSIGYCLDELPERIESYRRRLETMEAASLSVHGPFLDLNPSSNDSLIREASRKRFQQAYDAAASLGAKKIIYHTCFVPRVNFLEGWVDLTVPFWEEFLADKDDSIKIHLENVFDPTWRTIRAVAERIAHPAFSVCLDLGHANHASDIPLTEWIEGLGEYIGHIHIHDNDGITDGHLAVGDGMIPWDDVRGALRRICPDADYTVENCCPGDVKKTLNYLQNTLRVTL